jgi:hypothetical protein
MLPDQFEKDQSGAIMRFSIVIALTGLICVGCSRLEIVTPVELKATGSNDTYALVNRVLAPGFNAVETPDCGHKEFGPHITQIFDQTLNQYVFRFHAHRDHDDDRCQKSDRQRTEIKAYAKSPEPLLAKLGDVHTFRWKFKLDQNFQGSGGFTHLHQIKAVGGYEDSMPLVTLSARKGKAGQPSTFELNYSKGLKQRVLHSVELQPFLGQWVAVMERISFGEKGTYVVDIRSVATGERVFRYHNESIRMWKSNADFLRPKWGIYRSLKDKKNLRDEVVDFADCQIFF